MASVCSGGSFGTCVTTAITYHRPPPGLLAIKLDVEDAVGEHFTPIPREKVRR